MFIGVDTHSVLECIQSSSTALISFKFLGNLEVWSWTLLGLFIWLVLGLLVVKFIKSLEMNFEKAAFFVHFGTFVSLIFLANILVVDVLTNLSSLSLWGYRAASWIWWLSTFFGIIHSWDKARAWISLIWFLFDLTASQIIFVIIWAIWVWAFTKSRELGYLFLGIASNLAAILVTLLPVDAESRLLLEHLLTSIDTAEVWIMLCVSINMLHQVLTLRESAITYRALESLHCFVHVHKVAFETVERGEGAIAIIVEAFNTLLFWILTLKHSLKFILNLSFGFARQL